MIRNLAKRLARAFEEPSPAETAAARLPPTLAETRRLAERHRLADLLPWESYDDEAGLYHNDDSIGFVLSGLPAAGLGERELNILAGIFSQGLRPETTVQVCLYASPHIHPLLERWAAARPREGILGHLATRRIAHLRRGNWRSLLPGQAMLARTYLLMLCVQRPAGEPGEAEHLRRLREALRGVLASAGLPLWPMGPDDFLNVLDVLLNPPADHRRTLAWDPDGPPLREQAVSPETCLHVGRDGLALEHGSLIVDVRTFTARQIPKVWAGWDMQHLIGDLHDDTLRIPCPWLATLTVHVPDQAGTAAASKIKAARATQMADSPVGRFLPAWRERKEEWTYVTRLQDDGHRLLRLHHQVVLFAPRGEGDHAEHALKSVYEARGWHLARDRFVALPAFLAALPLTAGPERVRERRALGRWRTAISWTAVNVAPWIGEWAGTGTPLLMLLGRRGQIQLVDPFDGEQGNYNIACAATSGAGKSFLAQEMVTSLLATRGRVWIIDSGRSYENICRLVGGDFLEFAPDKPLCLNPFTRVRSLQQEMPLLKRLLAQMAVGDGTPLDSLHLAALERAIGRAWSDHGPETTVTRVVDALRATDEHGRRVADMLFPYTARGVYAPYFEGPANVTLDAPLVVLELGELDRMPDLRLVVLLLLMTRITEEMYLAEREQRKLCIIDEAWKLMAGGNAAQFIEEGYRTARKFGGAFMTITQGIDDYHRSETTRAAFANADWIFLLRQKAESIAAAAKSERLVLDDGLRRLLTSVSTVHGQYSEIAILGPSGAAIGRLVVDPFTEKLYSTRAEDFAAIRRLQREGLSLMEAVERLAGEARP